MNCTGERNCSEAWGRRAGTRHRWTGHLRQGYAAPRIKRIVLEPGKRFADTGKRGRKGLRTISLQIIGNAKLERTDFFVFLAVLVDSFDKFVVVLKIPFSLFANHIHSLDKKFGSVDILFNIVVQ